jgi:hypothetical protein
MTGMAIRKVSPLGGSQRDSAIPAAGLVDELLSRYVSWREHATAVSYLFASEYDG